MKSFTTFFLVVFFSINLFSQKKSVGFFVGMNQSMLLFEDGQELSEEWRSLHDLTVGINLTFPFNENHALRLELVHEFKGAYFRHGYRFVDGLKFGPSTFTEYDIGTAINNTGTFLWRENIFRYVAIPILYQYNLKKKGNYYINIGPSIGYLADHKDNYAFSNPRGFTKWDFSAIMGIGTCLPIQNRIAIQLNARTAYGINYIKKEGDKTLRHLVFSGLVGFQYLLD